MGIIRFGAPGAAVLAAQIATSAQDAPFAERVEVTRVLIDLRVFDGSGAPVTTLGASDFEVTIGGRAARVETVQWVGPPPAGAPAGAGPVLAPSPDPDAVAAPPALDPPGRLIVVLVQKDLHPSRVPGLMKLSTLTDRLLAPVTPDDRVAVLSFDSRLRIWTDFTSNLSRVRSVLRDDLLLRLPGPVGPSADVSLLQRIDPKTAARTHSMEDALRLIGESLEPLPGAKSVVLIGYGLGRWTMSGVILAKRYERAAAALKRARAAVFTLNVTRADYNSLQAGLESVSAETGGLYASLYTFPEQAVRRVAHALAGHYVVFVERPSLPAGAHRIDVRLISDHGRIAAARGFVLTE